MGVRAGPITASFCPSDEGLKTESNKEVDIELIQRLEEQVADLRLELRRLKEGERGGGGLERRWPVENALGRY
jgi:hypothetical protein